MCVKGSDSAVLGGMASAAYQRSEFEKIRKDKKIKNKRRRKRDGNITRKSDNKTQKRRLTRGVPAKISNILDCRKHQHSGANFCIRSRWNKIYIEIISLIEANKIIKTESKNSKEA